MIGLFRITSVVLLLALSIADPVGATDQEEFLERGNLLYQDGDYAGALDAYQSVLRAGFESADLHYNLGNSYFKTGDLGRSVLSFERALRLDSRDPDVRANLELARSLTVDEIEPLPRFWLLSAISWWVEFLPRGGLILIVVSAWILVATGICVRILFPANGAGSIGAWSAAGGLLALLLFGTTLLAQEGVLGGIDHGIILVEEVAVQSAPSVEDDLTLFHVHEGTKVRIDQYTDSWCEVVLEDGKVGWVPSGVLETI